MAKYTWLDEYLKALEITIGNMDLSTLQPTSWRHFHPLIASEWLEWVWKIIETREEKNISYKKIAQNFEPDLCREHLLFTLEDLKVARWPLKKRLKAAEFFYETLKTQMPQGDLFGLYGSTKRHSFDEIREIAALNFERGAPEIARELGKLYNGGYNLGAALYLDFYMGKAVENWGPYDLPNGKILVIKEMRFLKPKEIWPEIETECNKIDIYAIYEGVKFSTDLIACHSFYEGDTLKGLKEWRLEIDGSAIKDINEIKNIGSRLASIGSKQWKMLLSLAEPELLEKAMWIRCYCFNDVCKLLGLDWKPPKNLINTLQGKSLKQGWRTWGQPVDKIAREQYWRKIWDPRVEFYP